MNRAVFFDRDGIVNTRILGGYVRHWEEFEFLTDIGDALKAVKTKGYLAIIITNQRGVGTGLMKESDLNAVHAKMQESLLINYGVQFDGIISCTDPNNDSPRRKPSPAMIFEARDKWNIDLAASYFIGDSPSDIEAGERAGTKTIFLQNTHETAPSTATYVISQLSELPSILA